MTHQQQTAFENIVGKGGIARNYQFLLFPQCSLPNQIIVSPFVLIFDIISLFAARFEKPKIGISGKGFMGECNTSLNTYILYRHLAYYCTQPSIHFGYYFNPLPHDKILNRSKLKQIADDILRCISNGK